MAETWQEDLIRDGTLMRDGLQDIFRKTTITDRDIALELLTNSKAGLSALVKALTATSNRQLRTLLLNQLNAAAQEHFWLADLLAGRRWDQPHAWPEQQLGADAGAAQSLLSRH